MACAAVQAPTRRHLSHSALYKISLHSFISLEEKERKKTFGIINLELRQVMLQNEYW